MTPPDHHRSHLRAASACMAGIAREWVSIVIAIDECDIRRETRGLIFKCMNHDGHVHTPAETLRQKSDRLARELAPITIVEFQC